jgi:hypothetical protein
MDLLNLISPLIGKVIDRLWPDPAQAAAAKLEVLKMQQTGELAKLADDTDLSKAQDAINQAEAMSNNVFVAGPRPFILWICGFALAFQFLVAPLLTWGTTLFGKTVPVPSLDMGTLLTLLFGMLGLGAMHMQENIKGANHN